MAIGKPAQPLEFGSIDRKPVQMIILLVSPADKIAEHIQALGRVSKLMTNVQFRGACYAATSADEVYGLFRAAENPAAAAASRGA
jgi:mannitol/fructose-specific phosphotransferase system IIA component (Ntr-type)